MIEKKPDYILLSAVVILITLGVFILTSASAAISQEKPAQFLFHQIVFGLIPGFILGFIAFKFSLSFLKRWASVLLLANLVLLVLVFAPYIGVFVGGASRWIALGPIFMQPSEFLKLTFILYLATWLSSRKWGQLYFSSKTKRKERKIELTPFSALLGTAFVPFLLIVGFCALLLILQPNISTLGIIVLTAVIMYFLSDTPFWHSIFLVSFGAAALVFLIKTAPYRFNRLLVFLQPEFDPMKLGYQFKQALIAIGSGGVLGLGLGAGIQSSGFLPQSISDSIFALFAKETGFVGSLILISAFLIFVWRGFRIAKRSSDKFSCLAACGISFWITIQAFVNISSMTGILPLTGIPLPFISYGGSHLVAELTAVGILLNISKET